MATKFDEFIKMGIYGEGQVLNIPDAVRDELRLNPGDRVEFLRLAPARVPDLLGRAPAEHAGHDRQAQAQGLDQRHESRHPRPRGAHDMTGIDTNILVRYFAEDDVRQAEAARCFLASMTPESPGYVSTVKLLDQIPIASPAPSSVSTPSTAKMAAAMP